MSRNFFFQKRLYELISINKEKLNIFHESNFVSIIKQIFDYMENSYPTSPQFTPEIEEIYYDELKKDSTLFQDLLLLI